VPVHRLPGHRRGDRGHCEGPAEMTVIGARLPRAEDPRLLRGRGRFGDDFSAPGQLWARIVRSPAAHGEVRELDLAAARAAPGVVAVVTADDLPRNPVIPVRLAIA